MANSRRKYLQRTRKARMRELKPSPEGITSLGCSFGAAALFVISVVKSFQASGSGNFLIGSFGLLGLAVAIAAFFLANASLRQSDIRPLPAQIGRVVSLILMLVLAVLYLVGAFLS